MKIRFCLPLLLLTLLLSAVSLSCTSSAKAPLALASFNENYVDVSITLERDESGNAILAGTFTPPPDHHLYSKDIDYRGVGGLGRPTRLELAANSQLKALGGLLESAAPQEPDFEPKELLVYPAGPVTLRLPVQLPPGKDWVEEVIQVTYMACSSVQCKPPVEGKVVPIRIPGAEMFASQ
jgi:hypothetical protein